MNAQFAFARKWLEKSHPPGSAEEIIERLTSSMWSDMGGLPPAGSNVLAYLLIMWAQDRGITKFAEAQLEQLMYIVPEQNEFRLYCKLKATGERSFKRSLLKKLESTPHYRWVFAHEMAHTLFYDCCGARPVKPYPIRDPEEEQLCNRFASSLLMPRDSIEARVRRVKTVTLEWLLTTAQAFGVSVLELARRLIVELGVLNTTFALLKPPSIRNRESFNAEDFATRNIPLRIVSPRQNRFGIKRCHVLSSEAVIQTFRTGLPAISEQAHESCESPIFVESERIKGRPKGGIACLFHDIRPIRYQRTLFD